MKSGIIRRQKEELQYLPPPKPISKGTLNAIIKQISLTVKEFQEL